MPDANGEVGIPWHDPASQRGGAPNFLIDFAGASHFRGAIDVAYASLTEESPKMK
jgi:hypothetical protein